VGQLVMTIAAILQNIAKDGSSPSSLEFHPQEHVHIKQYSGLRKSNLNEVQVLKSGKVILNL